ncbi:quinoprotein dehydrogenase-associated SoxYZ-like carrier [Alkalilimnicola ehrlichii]|uniref:Quinoprotein dehydrogenase-associated SoxYZ-like carrier n=2 Tax=Alkalilimnicola ehrlichii TaxID=351052 RepID=A0A3E0WMC8_9GAMM|nr:quinoprotein dehydrogenase-associated SoxYZ-like carrier [Alkalilimnicola ehrlichii]RFA33126.1 quinoprotein dehydrogenase-associated SoxYZ-like carrier [Alkalilimnicola ehrlichii]
MLAALVLLASLGVPLLAVAADPLASPGWPIAQNRFLTGKTYVFDDRVQVIVPRDAEDSTAVPGFVRVQGIPDVQQIMVFAELNPIPMIVQFWPHRLEPNIGFRFKVQQATPVRAAALGADGIWYIGGAWVNAAGGGCSAPSIASADADWAERLGEVHSRIWNRGDEGRRLRLTVMHPMDTGLAAGIPKFYLEELVLVDDADKHLGRVEVHASVAENPTLTFDLRTGGSVRIQGADNNGNRMLGEVE